MEYKVERTCDMCGKKYVAASGRICADCWPDFKANSVEWQEFYRAFPWVPR